MQAETSLRFSQLSPLCLNPSQKPAVRRVWIPAGNLNRLRKLKAITADNKAAEVPSSLLVSPAQKTKQRRGEKTPQKRVFVYPSLA